MNNQGPTRERNDWPAEIKAEDIVISEAEIQRRVGELGADISRDYAGLRPRLIGILKGVTPFMADLIRAISIPMTTDYMSISKYRPESEATAAVRLLKDLDQSIRGEHVLLVEDIIDSGLTLFNKPANRVVDLPLHYIGFDLEDAFVVGYGLDYGQRYRNLRYLALLRTPRRTG
jgi:hypoxanthine phosphoribosyltransferase